MLTAKIAWPCEICGEPRAFFIWLNFILILNYFLPKMWKIFNIQHVNHPQHRFTKYDMCQVFNRITECDYIRRMSWWISGVIKLLVETDLFSYSVRKLDQPQSCLIWIIFFSKSTKLAPMIFCVKFYLEQAYFLIYENIPQIF